MTEMNQWNMNVCERKKLNKKLKTNVYVKSISEILNWIIEIALPLSIYVCK
jgi:hypothetical protein